MATRIYLAKIKAGDQTTRRLVRGSHPSPVVQHVSKGMIHVSVATQDELVECLSKGVKVEDMGDTAQLPLTGE